MATVRRNIGVRINDYRADVRGGLSIASRQAFSAVELGVDRGEVAPANLSESGRRHLARLVANTGMAFAALAQESHGARLADPSRVDEAVTRAAQVLRLAADMHVPVVSHEVGELLDLADAERASALEALRTLAEQAERVGTIYAVRSALADPATIAELVRAVDCPLVRVSVDPGALLMAGYDPAEALATLGDRVSLAYVRDAIRGSAGRGGREAGLGAGSLDLPAYLAALSAGGYHTAPILRRAEANDPVAALAADRDRLVSELAV